MARLTIQPRDDGFDLERPGTGACPRRDYLDEAFPLVLLLLTLSIALLQYQAVDWKLPYFGGDTIYPLNPRLDIHRLWSMWDDAQLGRPSLYPALPIFFGWFWLCSLVGLTVGFAENSLHFIYTVTAGLGAAGLALEICPWAGRRRTVCALGTASAYMLLPTAASLPTGWSVTAGIPLCVWGFIRALRARTAPAFVGAGLLGWLATMLFINDVPNYEIPAVQVGWYVALTAVVTLSADRIDRLPWRVGGYLAFAFGALLPLVAGLALEILPGYAASAAMTNARIGAGNSYGDLGHTLVSNTITLLAYYPAIYSQPITNVAALLPPLFSGFALRVRSPWILGIGLSTIVTIIVVVGPNPPTGALYGYLLSHVPGALAFRTTGKLLMFVALGYSALCPIGCFVAADLLRERFPHAPLFSWAALACALLALGRPILTGALFSEPSRPDNVPRRVPSSLARFGDVLERAPQRTLVVPEAGYLDEPLSGRPYFGPALTTYMFPSRVVESRAGTYGQPADPFIGRLYALLDATEPTRWLISPQGKILVHYVVSNGDALTVSPVGLATWRFGPRPGSHHLDIGPFAVPPAPHSSQSIVIGAFVRTPAEGPPARVTASVEASGKLLSRAHFDVPLELKSQSLRANSMAAIEIPAGRSRRKDFHLRLAVSLTARNRPRGITLYLLGMREGLTNAFYAALRETNIRYVYLDAGTNTLGVIGVEAVLRSDRHFVEIGADKDRRYLYRFVRHTSFIRFCDTDGCTPIPSPGYLPRRLAFKVPRAGTLVISQTYSPLWSISVRSARTNFEGHPAPITVPTRFGQEISLPAAGRYVLTSFYWPQVFLVAQWVIWTLAALLALALASYEVYAARKRIGLLLAPGVQYSLSGACGALAAAYFALGRAERSSWLMIAAVVLLCIAALNARARSLSHHE